jgi:hypothetical protein
MYIQKKQAIDFRLSQQPITDATSAGLLYNVVWQPNNRINIKHGDASSNQSFNWKIKCSISETGNDKTKAYFSTMKIEATCSSEMLVYFQWTTWRYVPEDRTLHNYCYENLKSYVSYICHQ